MCSSNNILLLFHGKRYKYVSFLSIENREYTISSWSEKWWKWIWVEKIATKSVLQYPNNLWWKEFHLLYRLPTKRVPRQNNRFFFLISFQSRNNRQRLLEFEFDVRRTKKKRVWKKIPWLIKYAKSEANSICECVTTSGFSPVNLTQ